MAAGGPRVILIQSRRMGRLVLTQNCYGIPEHTPQEKKNRCRCYKLHHDTDSSLAVPKCICASFWKRCRKGTPLWNQKVTKKQPRKGDTLLVWNVAPFETQHRYIEHLSMLICIMICYILLGGLFHFPSPKLLQLKMSTIQPISHGLLKDFYGLLMYRRLSTIIEQTWNVSHLT